MAQSEFDQAAATVKTAPQSMSAWDQAEELASAADRPDDMIALYRDVLQKGLEPQVVEMIGERAAAFCDEWFGDEPKVAEGILGRVLDLAPQSEQALQRCLAHGLVLTQRAEQARRVALPQQDAQHGRDQHGDDFFGAQRLARPSDGQQAAAQAQAEHQRGEPALLPAQYPGLKGGLLLRVLLHLALQRGLQPAVGVGRGDGEQQFHGRWRPVF